MLLHHIQNEHISSFEYDLKNSDGDDASIVVATLKTKATSLHGEGATSKEERGVLAMKDQMKNKPQ